jgi:hypothetical protein
MVRKAAVTEGDTRCWEDLVRAVKRESEMSGGYGEVVVSIKFHKGAPRDMKVLERKPQYRLGGGLVTARSEGT